MLIVKYHDLNVNNVRLAVYEIISIFVCANKLIIFEI